MDAAGFLDGRAAVRMLFERRNAPMSETPTRHRVAPAAPPEASARVLRAVRRMVGPVERFLAIEAASGIVLLTVAVAAMVWANSRWAGSYAALWHTPVGVRLGPWGFERDLHFWVNDGLMTIFFFVVGLEVRREMHQGELSEVRRAALPLAAALGGMLAPALIYLAFNAGRPSMDGWGVPMATDIAFAVGVLALLGGRVPPAVRILLLALAVIDDIGAILVIAIFYATGVNPLGFAFAAVGVVAILGLQRLGARSPLAYLGPAVILWAGALLAGVHPTIAGVVVGLLTPVRPWFGPVGLLEQTRFSVRSIEHVPAGHDHELLPHLDALSRANREAVSPTERLQHQLHGWVAYGIMPLFALANAGVPLGQASLAGDGLFVFLGVALGLGLGKPIGVLVACWAARRTGLAIFPRGARAPHLAVVGLVAGIGFTMALFIAQLAFPPGPLLETAKLAILCGSGAAAIIGYLAGRSLLSTAVEPGAAVTCSEAEADTAT
jgi:NhaA family Na+:H+ antiporter